MNADSGSQDPVRLWSPQFLVGGKPVSNPKGLLLLLQLSIGGGTIVYWDRVQ